jgi:hypothetical protein
MPIIVSETVLWPGATLKVLLVVRIALLATSWMQATPLGVVKSAATWAVDEGIIFGSEPLQANASAAPLSAAEKRIDILNPPGVDNTRAEYCVPSQNASRAAPD